MGLLHVPVEFKGRRWVKVNALVDTGASHCLLPRDVAVRAGLNPRRQRYRVRLADGRMSRVGGDAAAVRLRGREAPVLVLIGDAVEPILGAEALEALGVSVDLQRGSIKPTRTYTVRLGGLRLK